MRLIGRRDFLGCMGLGPGAYLLGAIFRSSLLPQAMGAAVTRKQFFLVASYQGFLESQYACHARGESDFDLAEAYRPLAAFKDDLVIASKLYNPVDIMQHGNSFAHFTVTASPVFPLDGQEAIPGGISIDRLIGKTIGADDPFPNLALNTHGAAAREILSADGLRQPVVPVPGPTAAFDRLFRPGLESPDGILRSQRTAVLDFLAADKPPEGPLVSRCREAHARR